MKHLVLYSAEGCHLCELAQEVIENAACFESIRLTEVSIASDVALARKYGDKVPVVCVLPEGDTLFWPFDSVSFAEWVSNYSV